MAKPKSQRKTTTQKTKGEDKPSQAKAVPLRRSVLSLAIGLFLILATLVVFWQVRNHEFISFDDNEYVTQNLRVKSGLTLSRMIWAFVAMHSNNWHSLT
jgi:hypothetical protein